MSLTEHAIKIPPNAPKPRLSPIAMLAVRSHFIVPSSYPSRPRGPRGAQTVSVQRDQALRPRSMLNGASTHRSVCASESATRNDRARSVPLPVVPSGVVTTSARAGLSSTSDLADLADLAGRGEEDGERDASRQRREPLDATVAIETPEHIVFRHRLAGPSRRALAYLLDLVVCYGALAVIGVFLLLALMSGASLEDARDELMKLGEGVFLVLLFAAQWVYFVALETWLAGRTVGKMAAGLRVVTTGGRPSGSRPRRSATCSARPTRCRPRTPWGSCRWRSRGASSGSAISSPGRWSSSRSARSRQRRSDSGRRRSPASSARSKSARATCRSTPTSAPRSSSSCDAAGRLGPAREPSSRR